MRKTARALALATALAVGSGSCAYVLHPERRGNHAGVIDGLALALDLLWCIPGVVPGLVMLVIDFTSGAIYIQEENVVEKLDSQRLDLEVPPGALGQPADVEVTTASGEVLLRQRVTARQGARSVDLRPLSRWARLHRHAASRLAGLPLRLRPDAGHAGHAGHAGQTAVARMHHTRP